MNIIKLLESFTNEGMINSLSTKGSRRDSFTQLQKMGSVAAMAAVPFGLSAILAPTKANAATAAFFGPAETPTEALQLALVLEYLEDEFYAMALDSGIIPVADQAIIAQIAKHENAHVAFLKAALKDAAPAKPTFDFTGRRGSTATPPAFDPFNDYPTLLALSQAFEDTGVRAYKGQAGNLISNGDFLTAALQIHSVEAMHASQIRRLRGQKGWIIGKDRGGLPAAAQAIYDGEENTIQGGFETATVGNFPAGSASESFDEALSGSQSKAIAQLFIVETL